MQKEQYIKYCSYVLKISGIIIENIKNIIKVIRVTLIKKLFFIFSLENSSFSKIESIGFPVTSLMWNIKAATIAKAPKRNGVDVLYPCNRYKIIVPV